MSQYAFLFRNEYDLFLLGYEPIRIPLLFDQRELIVGIFTDSTKKATGVIQQILSGFPYKLIGDSAVIYQGYQVISFKYRGNFFLEFLPYTSTQKLEISIYHMPLSNPSTGGALPSTSTVGKPTTLDTTASKILIAANVARLGATLYNSSTAPLYVALGSAASATAFSFIVTSGGYYELPYGYQGDVQGILVAKTNVSGTVLATEFT